MCPVYKGGILINRVKRAFSVFAIESFVLMMLCTCTSLPESASATSEIKTKVVSQEVIESLRDTEELIREKVSIYEKAREEMAQEQESEKASEPEQVQEAEQDQTDKSEENAEESVEEEFYWDGQVITPQSGVADGPSGYETYYNLPMGGVVNIMRGLGYDEESYPYWEREDGCKMLGDYIMVAANLNVRPYGTILPCSRGMAIVCDTGDFAYGNPEQLDIAVNW